jgi:hypothetical protein
VFDYSGGGVFGDLGFGGAAYAGEVYGWSHFNPSSIERYAGPFIAGSLFGNLSIPGLRTPVLGVSGGLIGFTSPDRLMYGYAGFVGTGLSLCLPIDGNLVFTDYVFKPATKRSFHDEGKKPTSQDAQEFIAFIEATMTNPARKQEAKKIVKENGLYWDGYHHGLYRDGYH